jgi:hypothetical protein
MQASGKVSTQQGRLLCKEGSKQRGAQQMVVKPTLLLHCRQTSQHVPARVAFNPDNFNFLTCCASNCCTLCAAAARCPTSARR